MAFLESMGLPKSKLHATRKEIESGKLSFGNEIEYKMYSRHDQPADYIESDAAKGAADPALGKQSPANK